MTNQHRPEGTRPAHPPLTNASLWLLRGLFAICLLMALAALAGAIGSSGLGGEMARAGVETTATVVDLRQTGGRSGVTGSGAGYSRPRYNVYYRFQAGDRVVTDRREVSRSRFDSLSRQQRIPVRYLPGEPGIHEIETSFYESNAFYAALVAIVFGALAGLLGYVSYRLPRRIEQET